MMSPRKTHKAGPEEDGRLGYILCRPRLLGTQIKLHQRVGAHCRGAAVNLHPVPHQPHVTEWTVLAGAQLQRRQCSVATTEKTAGVLQSQEMLS